MEIYSLIKRHILFRMDPELAHRLAILALRMIGSTKALSEFIRNSILGKANSRPINILGLNFPSPLGLAAGFDKDGVATFGAYALGFGFLEVGSVTLRPWQGNKRPRLFRIPAAKALVNSMGLPSVGAERVAKNLRRRPPIPLLVNLAKTGDPTISSDAAIEDVAKAASILSHLSDGVVLNLSCPNTEDGRSFQDPPFAKALLQAVVPRCGGRPVLLKVSPDLDNKSLEGLVEVALKHGAKGFVATNTTLSREGVPDGPWRDLQGGLSGQPLHQRAVETVRRLRAMVGKGPVIIGCGGVFTRADMERFLEAGADLVEAYTGLVFQGPLFCRHVLKGKQDGAK